MTDLSQRLAALPEQRRTRFLAQLRAQARDAAAQGPAPRRDAGPAPLSYAQETLWSRTHLAPDGPAGSVPLCLRLRGDLDVAALRSALAAVVARHEALRTAIVPRGDGPVQVVAPAVPVELPVVEVPGADAGQRLAAARALVDERVREPVAVDRTPWRAALLRVAPDDHLFLFVAARIAVDDRSLDLLTGELAEIYRASRDGGEPRLPALAVQYPDYAVWQRDRRDAAARDRVAGHWRERLAGAEALEFPTDLPRGDALRTAAGVASFPVGPDGLARAHALARDAGAAPFDVLAAAFLTLLHRYCGTDDLVLGAPDGDRHPAVADLIGCFGTLLPLRGDVSGDPTFRELVGRVRRAAADARAHADLPFAALLDAAGLAGPADRDPARPPVFPIVFEAPDARPVPDLPGLVVTEEPVRVGTARFDMTWRLVAPPGSTARLDIEFRADLFDPDSITRFARHYDALLCGLTADPDAPLSAVDMLSPAERRFLAEVSRGPVRPVRETTIVEQFEARVAEAPDRVAVVVTDVATTYADLNARANRLAALLRGRGAGPGARIGLCLRRTPDLPAAVLGVLKTGAAYVPLDPTHPPARVAEIAADAGVRAVLAHAEVAGAVADVAAPVVLLDDVAAELAALPATNPPPAAGPGDVAYVIYTSGSTGRPKGVLLEHRGVVNFIDSTTDLFALTPADRVLGFASMTFDVSVFETFAALLTGARLCLATDAERQSIDRLQSLMERAGVTVIDLPPTVMPLLAPERLPDLRIAFVGGEAFSGDLVNRWNPGRRLFNGYGPTECTVTMIVAECPGTWDTTPPIGLPMANHVAHVLDRDLRPVPVGVPGELVIGGAGLARGYLNRDELTGERFVPDPFGTAPGGRLYRTGDLVKRLPDGRLVFLGRLDQQVKIRGLRIELGEVESALATFAGIGPVSVQPWTDAAGDRHLVGYLTGVTEAQLAAVREHLRPVLPSYMIPSYFVVLAELPLTSSGKVDRRRLPAPDPGAAGAGPGDEPRTATERALLREVIGPLLRTDRLGVHDDFFQAGGNSLQAAQLMSAIHRRFDVEVALADFFVAPTAAHLATIIDAARATRLSDDLPGHTPVLLRAPAPARLILIHPSGGALFCYVPLVRALRDGIGVAGFPADPRDATLPAADAMTATAARIAGALAATGGARPYRLAGWSYGGVLAFEVARQLERDTGARPPVVLLDADYGADGALDEATIRRRFVHDVARLAGRDGPAVRAVLADPAAGRADIRTTLASLGVELDLSDAELAGRFAVFRGCALAEQAYHPPGPYGGPVTLLAVAPRAAAEQRWRAVCAGPFRCVDLPGDHYTVFTEPALRRVVAEIERTLTP